MAAPFPSPTRTWHDNTYASLSPSNPHLSQTDKAVLITGGGTGIGAATAHTFAAAGAAYIALLGRRAGPLVETKASIERQYPHTKVFTAPTDVTVQAEVESAFKAFFEFTHGKGINVLVAGAAIIGPQVTIDRAESEQFFGAIEANLRGALYTGQAFLKYRAETEETVVIDVNSSAAHVNFAPGFASYTIAKWAAYRFWDSLGFESLEKKKKGKVRVHHIQPGVVDTDMNREAGGVKAMGFEDHVSLPAGFTLWLTSPQAKFLDGKFLWANWDVDELEAMKEEIKKKGLFDLQLVGWPFGEKGYVSGWNA
ncbi:putative oxidoreductase [Aspergillus pseudoustus]|uniref:Oxidoreductase n=1 Tax=Aspergillus pseudoustus TaxID=1810923 RepID=A0ABR4INH9_9EURO